MSDKKRPEWMTSISANVDSKDYLLGRKIDKTFELSLAERAKTRQEARTALFESDQLKLTGDPLLELERKKLELRHEILSNPAKLKQLREHLLKEDAKEKLQSCTDEGATHSKSSVIKYKSSREYPTRDEHESRRERYRGDIQTSHRKDSRQSIKPILHDRRSRERTRSRSRSTSSSSTSSSSSSDSNATSSSSSSSSDSSNSDNSSSSNSSSSSSCSSKSFNSTSTSHSGTSTNSSGSNSSMSSSIHSQYGPRRK